MGESAAGEQGRHQEIRWFGHLVAMTTKVSYKDHSHLVSSHGARMCTWKSKGGERGYESTVENTRGEPEAFEGFSHFLYSRGKGAEDHSESFTGKLSESQHQLKVPALHASYAKGMTPVRKKGDLEMGIFG